jgi:hypothetical protein
MSPLITLLALQTSEVPGFDRRVAERVRAADRGGDVGQGVLRRVSDHGLELGIEVTQDDAGNTGQLGRQLGVEGGGHGIDQAARLGIQVLAEWRSGHIGHVDDEHLLGAFGDHQRLDIGAQLGTGGGHVGHGRLRRLCSGGDGGQFHEDVVGAGQHRDEFLAGVAAARCRQVRAHLVLDRLGGEAQVVLVERRALPQIGLDAEWAGDPRAALGIVEADSPWPSHGAPVETRCGCWRHAGVAPSRSWAPAARQRCVRSRSGRPWWRSR